MATLKQHRQYAGFSVNDAADHMAVTARTIYTWEDGSRQITAITLAKLLKFYQVEISTSAIPHLFPAKKQKRGDATK